MKNLKLTGILLTMLIVLAGCSGVPATTTTTSRSAAAPAAALGPDELDETIREASDYINNNIPAGNFIVILNIQSGSAALSDYIIDELIANAVNDKNFSVVDRQRLDEIRKEQNFQTSGEVDDDQALSIGRFIGAQSIVTGSVSTLGSRYRITVRALDVETAKVQAQFNKNIAAGETIVALMGMGAGGGTAAGRQTTTASGAAAAASQSSAGGQQAAPARTAPAVIPNGTYNFWPRIQAIRAGQDVEAYIDRIVVRSGFFNVYVIGAPIGGETTIAPEQRTYQWTTTPGIRFFLQDLDTPRLVYNATGNTTDSFNLPVILSFENKMTGRRFSLTYRPQGSTDPSVARVFEEINLDEAEYEP